MGFEERIDTAMLQRYFEQSSGQDLADFDYWIYGGYIPSVETKVRFEKDGVYGCVETDIPFGTMTVPVRIHLSEQSVDTIVTVRHGKGAFVPNASKDTKFETDPLNLLLAFKRNVSTTTQQTTCDR